MDFIQGIFSRGPAIPRENRAEVDRMTAELIDIGRKEDFLSEHAGGSYDGHFRHVRTRAIGRRINEIGSLPLMEWVRDRVKRKLGKNMAEHLNYAWADIGRWIP